MWSYVRARGLLQASSFAVHGNRLALSRNRGVTMLTRPLRPLEKFHSHRVAAQQVRYLSDRRQDEEEARAAQQKQGLLSRGLGAATTGAVLLMGKTKWVLGGLKFMKLMPALSMLASTGAYAFFFGWPFAVGMVGQIAVHEAGHLLAMKHLGIPAGPMVFIPFMGASVEMKDRPKDVREEAIVAFGGPVVGGASALALSAAGVYLDSQLLVALADFGLMINLFNLLPLGSLDGGRIGGAISRWFLVAGLGGGIAMAYNGMVHNPLFFLILITGGFTTFDRFFGSGTHDSYYRIPLGQRGALTCAYLLLIAVLLAGMAWNQSHKKSLKELQRMNPEKDMGEYGRRLEHYADQWADDAKDDEARRFAEQERVFIERHFGSKDL